ncbi:MAG: hypothetical protein RQ745_11245, partial [Longimicrobiales bacterium]|nr:hypothetical protein [Longimicrobiales bacterium]
VSIAALAPDGDGEEVVSIAALAPDADDEDEDDAIESSGTLSPSRRVVTRTLAELFAEQGLIVQALAIFDELIARHPEDDALRARRDELGARVESTDAGKKTPEAPLTGSEPASGSDASGPPISLYLGELLTYRPPTSRGGESGGGEQG